MTVHKSKGLEFKVVFLIGMADGVMPNKQGDIEEERRIAFVGLSRAMQRLYLTYPQMYSGRSIKKSRFLTEIFGN
jgi:DNA helicase-2/ATP-dependent DNA helicase PcrA